MKLIESAVYVIGFFIFVIALLLSALTVFNWGEDGYAGSFYERRYFETR